MSTSILAVVILGPTALVVAALFIVLWRERTSTREARVALVSGGVVAVWAVTSTALAKQGFFQPPDAQSVPPVGINLAVVLLLLAVCLAVSPSLRSLLSRQENLIRLHLWRFEGVVFLMLMARGQMPALWALPAGIGDILVAATAPWVASHLATARGRRRAIIWNLFGIADLVVAIGLGVMTNPGPTQVFYTTPTAEMVTRFPLALVPTFLVPLAFTLHIVSLWQLLGGNWAHPAVERRTHSRTWTDSPATRGELHGTAVDR
jgi:hypothetical protein